ncbi:hypothetical protein PRN20_03590 [Devosia sp. ZB163]|uniref:hypothetical protein n=1 Tax=Devosia sp. ZB163 TaxID=3025938 RepID=UPI002360BF43|nr:hypothetical protein [Devosia sp. ZB163]MDC9822805.1 hypothetical protein [Devosia sp. ZB163]
MPTPALTPDLIAAHERLHPRLASLLKQVERTASRRPTMAVPEASLKLARELCREAARLLGREGRGIGAPKPAGGAPLDQGGLAIHLGQALAGLEQFEAAHSGRDFSGNAVWQLPGGETVPITRLRMARPGFATAAPKPSTQWRDPLEVTDAEMRSTVLKRILQRENAVYLEGYRDGRAGKPPRKPLTRIGPVNESTEID